ncbi:MAG TPA: hypothetical protein VIG94_05660 [Faecalibacter sp.]
MKKINTLIIFYTFNTYSYSQVGININDPKSTLHIKESRLPDNTNETTKSDGILIPKLTKAELSSKATSSYQSINHEGVLVYVTEVSQNVTGPSIDKVLNINSTGYYFLNNQNIWEPVLGLGIDKSDDAWLNNPEQTRLELHTNSLGEIRTIGSEIVITDSGYFGINNVNPTKRLDLNASIGENTTDFIRIENLAFPPNNIVTNTLQIDEDGLISRRGEENIEGKILRLPLGLQSNITNLTPRTLTIEANPLLSPNLTPNLISLIPGYIGNSNTEFTLPAGLYKYEIRLIGYFSKEDPHNAISLTTYVNNTKYSTHYYGSNTRVGYFINGNANQNYTNLIKSDFIELNNPSRIKFEVTNHNSNDFTVMNYVALSGQRSYRSVILFQRIK